MRRLVLDFVRRVAGTTQLRAHVAGLAQQTCEAQETLTSHVASLAQQQREAQETLASHVASLTQQQREAQETLAAHIANLTQQLEAQEALVRHVRSLVQHEEERADYLLPDWWQASFWEPTVALAIRDHVRPGDIVYDAGANAGALSMQMSRLTGPRGTVCAFEASPRILQRTQFNLVRAGCNNVTLFHRAVWRTTGETVNIAPGSHLNDRVDDGAPGVPVLTVALDDFVAATALSPSFIKMDIEGAELAALEGMPHLLREGRPVLVLEQSPLDMRCHALLSAAGYRGVDLASYREIHTDADFDAGTRIANVLFVPREVAGTSPYFGAPAALQMEIAGDRFTRAVNGDVALPHPPTLAPGRYVMHADFTADSVDNEIFAGVEADGVAIFRYHTNARFMARSHRRWVFQIDHAVKIAPYLRFLRGGDAGLVWRGVRIFRLPSFDDCPRPAIA